MIGHLFFLSFFTYYCFVMSRYYLLNAWFAVVNYFDDVPGEDINTFVCESEECAQ